MLIPIRALTRELWEMYEWEPIYELGERDKPALMASGSSRTLESKASMLPFDVMIALYDLPTN